MGKRFMVRLTDEDYSALESRASEMGIPVAMLARSILHRELAQVGQVGREVEELEAVAADSPVVAAEVPEASEEEVEAPASLPADPLAEELEQSERPRVSGRGRVPPDLLPDGAPKTEDEVIKASGTRAQRRERKRRNKGKKKR